MKIIRINNNTVVILNNGNILEKELTEIEYNNLCNSTTEEEIIRIMVPAYKDILDQKTNIENMYELVNNSSILIKEGDSIYWKEVCELSMPKELVEAVLKAEQEDDEDKLTAYKNFWTLMALNPDSRCRQNLFWFLNKWGMTISKYGLFVGYRNVDIYKEADDEIKFTKEQVDFVVSQYERIKHNKKSPKNYIVDFEYGPNNECKLINAREGYNAGNLHELYQYFKERHFDLDLINPNTETIYTDYYSHTFRIKIGELVTMPREKCNTDFNQECQSGLHIGGQGWLNQNYFGGTGLICLVNPAKVVAVPHNSEYGKLRTCAYLPIGTVKYDNCGKVIPYNLEDGFESSYVKEVLYSGEKGTEDTAEYIIKVPEIPELNKNTITQAIIDIANQAIKDRIQ